MSTEKLYELFREKLGLKHNWTKDKMDDCRSVFIDQIQNYFWNHSGKYRSENIAKLIRQYTQIEGDVGRLEYLVGEINRKFQEWYLKNFMEEYDHFSKEDLKRAFTSGYMEGKNENNRLQHSSGKRSD